MKKKKILIIGGGISGLSALHYLMRRYHAREDVEMALIEKESRCGGTIKTTIRNSAIFDWGPNGFLSSKSEMLHLCRHLGIAEKIISASDEAKERYISVKKKLIPLPRQPLQFFSFPAMNVFDKMRLLWEPFIRPAPSKLETVYDFTRRRFGTAAAEIMADPAMLGIYGAGARKLILSEALPRLYALESEYGSVMRGVVKMIKKMRNQRVQTENKPVCLMSFQGGMKVLTETLSEKYRLQIHTACEAKSVYRNRDGYEILTNKGSLKADVIYLAAPAYCASDFLQTFHPELSRLLGKIHYAPMAVVGLLYSSGENAPFPRGFGYLVPTGEKRNILGALYSSRVFPGRCAPDKFFVRVMIGAEKAAEIVRRSDKSLIESARTEIAATLAIKTDPLDTFCAKWPRAIPQYDLTYVRIKDRIKGLVQSQGNIHIVANYLEGVAMGDCIVNARKAAQKCRL